MYRYQDKTWFKAEMELRRQEFLNSMDLKEDELRGVLVIDAGCSNGKLTASASCYGSEMVRMELSRCLERAPENCRAHAKEHSAFAQFVQGNVMEPPFAGEAIDHTHSNGVLYHTPDSWRGFRRLLTIVRPGKVYLDRVKGALRPGMRWLDIGCGRGLVPK